MVRCKCGANLAITQLVKISGKGEAKMVRCKCGAHLAITEPVKSSG